MKNLAPILLALALAALPARGQFNTNPPTAIGGGSSRTNPPGAITSPATSSFGGSNVTVVGAVLATPANFFEANGIPRSVITNNATDFGHLYRWQNALVNSNRPFRLYMTSDQDANSANWPFDQAAYFRQLVGTEGGVMQGGGAAGEIEMATSGGYQETYVPELFIGTATTPYRLTNGAHLTFKRVADSYETQTNVLANRGHVVYLTHPLGATFKIYTNLAGAGWGEFLTINDYSATTNLVSTNLTLIDGRYQLRVTNTSGTNRILAAGLWLSTNHTVLPIYTYLNAGPSITNWMPSSSNGILSAWFRIMSPDLMLVQDTGPTNAVGAWPQFEAMMATSAPNADLVIIGQFANRVDTPGSQNDWHAWNQGMWQHARTYGRGFFNTEQLLPNVTAQDIWTNIGLLDEDQIHFEQNGGRVLNKKLWDQLIGSSWLLRDWTTNRIFNGTFELRIGATKGDRLRIEPGSFRFVSSASGGGGFAVTNYEAGGASGMSSLFLGNSPTLPVLESDATTAGYLTGTNHFYFRTYNRGDGYNGVNGRMWPSGGFTFWKSGGTVANIDPGQGGMLLGGNLTTIGTNFATVIFTTNGVVFPQLTAVPTNSILASSAGGTNWTQCNINGMLFTLATNYAAAGSFMKMVGGVVSAYP